jgi:hypothetical protein
LKMEHILIFLASGFRSEKTGLKKHKMILKGGAGRGYYHLARLSL